MKKTITKYIIINPEEVKEFFDKNEAKETYEKWKAEKPTTELKKIITTIEELTYNEIGFWD